MDCKKFSDLIQSECAADDFIFLISEKKFILISKLKIGVIFFLLRNFE